MPVAPVTGATRAPGGIDTDVQRALQAQDGRLCAPPEHMDPADVARAVRLAVDVPPGTGLDEVRVRTTLPLR